jgi:hypothetical protein
MAGKRVCNSFLTCSTTNPPHCQAFVYPPEKGDKQGEHALWKSKLAVWEIASFHGGFNRNITHKWEIFQPRLITGR